VVLEIFYLFSVRFVHGTSLTWRGVLGTPAVLIGVGFVAVLQLAFTYAPPMQALFDTVDLSTIEATIVLSAGVLLLAIVELEKWIVGTLSRGSHRSSRATAPARSRSES
jgi:magnesium-transporting ATPase (P-type)